MRFSFSVPPLDLGKSTTTASTTNITNATGATGADVGDDDDFFTQPVPKDPPTLPTGTLTRKSFHSVTHGLTSARLESTSAVINYMSQF